MLTRLVSLWLAATLLSSSPAAAQKPVLVDGVRALDRAMMAGDAAGVSAAVDRIAAALAAWDSGSAPPPAALLLDDEAAETPILPLAPYADGFAGLLRGDYHAALLALRRAAATVVDERAQLFLAGTLARQGRDAEAERTLRSIVASSPGSGVAHWWLARVYERLSRVAEARREYEAAVSVALSGRARLYEAIGRLSRAEGDFARAADAYQRRLRLTPNDPAAHRALAGIHLEQNRTPEALAAFSAAVSIDPRDAEAHAAIGRIRLDAGVPAEAVPALRRALDLMPALYEARYALAQALKQIGRGVEAARELELFERARRESTEQRRRAMASEARALDAARQERAR